MSDDNKSAITDPASTPALRYHELPRAGKLEVRPTKPLANPRDLSLAYSPGVAEACMAIKTMPLTLPAIDRARNLVAVVSNGTAVAWARQHRPACLQARHGRQGGPVQEVRRISMCSTSK